MQQRYIAPFNKKILHTWNVLTAAIETVFAAIDFWYKKGLYRANKKEQNALF